MFHSETTALANTKRAVSTKPTVVARGIRRGLSCIGSNDLRLLPLMILKHPLYGVLRQLGHVFQLQPLLDSLSMGINRFGTQTQFARDLSRRKPLTDHLKNLNFAI